MLTSYSKKALKMNFLILITLLCIIAQALTKSTVKISVYYESLCPDCIAFVTKQLNANYLLFGDEVINLELIPYGNAKTITDANGNKSFICQHGPSECYGNEIHGCVVEMYSANVSESFVACSEYQKNPTSGRTLKRCAYESAIPWKNLKECYSSGKAFEIMEKNGLKTKQINPPWVPTIVFNDNYNEAESKQAATDLKTVICKYLNNQPDSCKSTESVLTSTETKKQSFNDYVITIVE